MKMYRLDENRIPVLTEDVVASMDPANKRVGLYESNDGSVSTVFLGLDHRFGDGPPLVFETMIFGGTNDGYQDRCSTWDEAVAMHTKAVEAVKAGVTL